MMQQLGTLPLWVKQVIYAQFRHELEATLSKATLEAFGPEHTLQLWIPEITRQGVQELEKPTGQLEQGMLRLLHLTRFHKNVLSITIMNNWSLEQSSIFISQAIEKEFISPPMSMVIAGTVDYLAGRTRLGEYLVQINRLTIEQLDQALRTQRAIAEAMGERTGIANVLINLGYIKKEDSEAILFLKEESKKPFPGIQGGLPAGGNEALVRLQGQLQQAMNRIKELETANYQLQKKV
ncbi:hypothetical protein [Vampirovibrio sp.]|uniref:hypothetical protein n=1 Tax=Vampirovibrio sp. TaxID=2717857 RepID=UPI003592ED90